VIAPTLIEQRLLKLPPSVRRRILQNSYAIDWQAQASNGEIVFAIGLEGEAHTLVADPQPCGVCGKPHAMFVTRKGRTACWECDAASWPPNPGNGR
jgi:hypothetical protein